MSTNVQVHYKVKVPFFNVNLILFKLVIAIVIISSGIQFVLSDDEGNPDNLITLVALITLLTLLTHCYDSKGDLLNEKHANNNNKHDNPDRYDCE